MPKRGKKANEAENSCWRYVEALICVDSRSHVCCNMIDLTARVTFVQMKMCKHGLGSSSFI